MKNIFRGGALLAAICFVFALAAKADDIHLCAVASDCNTGSVIAISSGTTSATLRGGNPGLIEQQLFLAVLTPLTDKSGNWNDNKTTLWSRFAPPVDCGHNCKFPNLKSAISQESGSGLGISPLSFNVTDISEGAWLFSGEHIPLPSASMGTIFMAFTEDAHGKLTSVTPWSSSLIVTPEPSSLLMVAGAGLAGLLGWLMKAKA
jgi:PEP-CTERM motif